MKKIESLNDICMMLIEDTPQNVDMPAVICDPEVHLLVNEPENIDERLSSFYSEISDDQDDDYYEDEEDIIRKEQEELEEEEAEQARRLKEEQEEQDFQDMVDEMEREENERMEYEEALRDIEDRYPGFDSSLCSSDDLEEIEREARLDDYLMNWD